MAKRPIKNSRRGSGRKRPGARSPGRPRAKAAQTRRKTTKTAAKTSPKAKAKTGVARKRTRPAPRRRAGARRRSSAGLWRSASFRRYLDYAASGAFFVFAAAIAFTAFSLVVIRDLPSTDGLWRNDRAPQIALVAHNGAPIPVQGRAHGAPVRLADLPAYVPEAILAIEDRNFYHHIGVNPFSIIRALMVNARSGEVLQGGSTITQQLAKNLFLSPDQTLERKLQELYLAFWLEARFSKEELLTLYLNRVYFGSGAYGVEAASHRYFGRSASTVSLPQAAMLAGVLKAPSRYSPLVDADAARGRQQVVINAMMEAGYLDYYEAQTVMATPLAVADRPSISAPYFADAAIREARAKTAGLDSDLEVTTTLRPDMQTALETGVAVGLAYADLPDDVEVAGVIMDADGAVLALIGGRDYGRSQFNRAVDARRQPGSAFKPFVFLAALEQGYSPRDRLDDAPITVDGWSPDNYRSKFKGDVSLTTALALSLNAATISLQEQVGRGAVRVTARRMGVTSPLSQGAAIGLGVDVMSPIELASAYAPFANGGFRVAPHFVSSASMRSGRRIYRADGAVVDVAASQNAIARTDRMLASVVKWGTGKNARIGGVRVAGKTGTSQGSRDAWFVGYAEGMVAAIWVGHDDNRPMHDVTGGGAPALIWRDVVSRGLAQRGRSRPVTTPALSTLTPAPQTPGREFHEN